MKGINVGTIIIRGILISILLLMICACGEKKQLNTIEFADWYQKNKEQFKLTHSTKLYDYHFVIIPSEVVAIKKGKGIKEKVKAELVNNEGFLHCYLEIQPTDNHSFLGENTNSEGFNQRLQYFSYGVSKDITIQQCSDTLYMKNFHLERYYNHAPDRLNMVFEQDSLCRGDQVITFNADIFNEGLIKFKLRHSLLDELPDLML